MNNRVEELLRRVRDDIRRSREAGVLSTDYEKSVETDHHRVMGLDTGHDERVEENLLLLRELNAAMEAFSEIETDQSRSRLLRLIREVAMSRHQLRRMNSELRRINSMLVEMMSRVLEEAARLDKDRAVRMSADAAMIQERVAVIDQLVVLVRDLQGQVDDLRGATETNHEES